jgi:hypothetical protein
MQRVAWGLRVLCALVACGLSSVRAGGPQELSRTQVVTQHTVELRGALPVLEQVAAQPGGGYAVFSSLADQDFVSLGIFSSSGGLVKNLAGTSVPTGLPRLTSLEADSRGVLWVTTLHPVKVARFDQNGLLSVDALAKVEVGYALALDEPRGYVYVGGYAGLPGGACLLIHQFAVAGMRFRQSFLKTNPDVLRKSQFPIQWVPLDVDPHGIV